MKSFAFWQLRVGSETKTRLFQKSHPDSQTAKSEFFHRESPLKKVENSNFRLYASTV